MTPQDSTSRSIYIHIKNLNAKKQVDTGCHVPAHTFYHRPISSARARSSSGFPWSGRTVRPPRDKYSPGRAHHYPHVLPVGIVFDTAQSHRYSSAPITPILSLLVAIFLAMFFVSSTKAPKPPTAAGERRACAAAVIERQSPASVHRCARPPQNKAERVQSRRAQGQKGAW